MQIVNFRLEKIVSSGQHDVAQVRWTASGIDPETGKRWSMRTKPIEFDATSVVDQLRVINLLLEGIQYINAWWYFDHEYLIRCSLIDSHPLSQKEALKWVTDAFLQFSVGQAIHLNINI